MKFHSERKGWFLSAYSLEIANYCRFLEIIKKYLLVVKKNITITIAYDISKTKNYFFWQKYNCLPHILFVTGTGNRLQIFHFHFWKNNYFGFN